MRFIVVAGMVVAAGGLLITVNWLLATRGTDPRLLDPNPIQRSWRRLRAFWARFALDLFAWPHVIELSLGTRKAPVAQTPNDVVWQHGPATLHRYRSAARGEPVLIVHSLVSQPWILDLAPRRSFIEFLLSEGFDVFLLDWGTPGRADAQHGFSAHTDTLMKAESKVLELRGSERLHLVGYCLGGLLCLVRMAARRHVHIATVTLLATPVDFSLRVALQPWITNPLFKPVYFLDGSSCVPSETLRESFHILRPQALRTVLGAWRRRRDEEFRRRYDPLARWVWEHRPLAGQVFFDLVELFRHNGLMKGILVSSGELARLSDVKAPILNLIAKHDHIVPSASSHALSDVPGLKLKVVEVPSGHVSMVSGSTARNTTWPAIADWLADHSSGHSSKCSRASPE